MKRSSQIEEELFPFYALDALTAEERAEVEAYVAINPDARVRLAELIESVAHLGVAIAPISPSPAVKQQLMQRVHHSAGTQRPVANEPLRRSSLSASPQPRSAERPPATQPRRHRFQRPLFMFATIAGAALAVFAIVSAFLLQQRLIELQTEMQTLQSDTVTLQAQLDDLETRNATLQQRLTEHQEILAVYQQPGAVTLAIGDATGEHPLAVGTLTLEPDNESAVLLASNLEPLDQDSVYQLWLIHGTTPVSAGTFSVDETGSGTLLVSAVQAGFNAVGVSIEPEGGSEQPTPGNIVLLGPVS